MWGFGEMGTTVVFSFRATITIFFERPQSNKAQHWLINYDARKKKSQTGVLESTSKTRKIHKLPEELCKKKIPP